MTRYTPMYVQDGSYAASQDRRLIAALWPAARSTGCAVTVASAMTLNVAPGSVAVPTQNNTGSTLCVSDANEQVVVAAAPPSGQSRIDLLICRPRDNDLDGSSNSDFIFDTVAGVPAASPTIPATPAGTVALYQVTVPGGAAALVAGNLADVRPGNLSPPPTSGVGSAALGWVANGAQSTLVTVGSSMTTIMTASFPAVAGRRYMVVFVANGNQATAAGNVQISAQGQQAVAHIRAGVAAGANVTQQIIAYAVAATTGTLTLNLQALTTAGSMAFSPGYNFWDAFDMGAHP